MIEAASPPICARAPLRGGEAGGSLDRTPDHDHNVTAWTQHAMHLAQSDRPVGEELKTELTEHDVESLVSERQRPGVGLAPLDRRTVWSRERPGNGKHARIEISRDDRPALAHLLGRDARHHSSGSTRPFSRTGATGSESLLRVDKLGAHWFEPTTAHRRKALQTGSFRFSRRRTQV